LLACKLGTVSIEREREREREWKVKPRQSV
jgi:hypothetical protein